MVARQASVSSTGDTFFERMRSDACFSVSAERSGLTTGLLRRGFRKHGNFRVGLQGRFSFVPFRRFLISVSECEYVHLAEPRAADLQADGHAVFRKSAGK